MSSRDSTSYTGRRSRSPLTEDYPDTTNLETTTYPSPYNTDSRQMSTDSDETYTEENSIDEVEAALQVADDNISDTLGQWASGPNRRLSRITEKTEESSSRLSSTLHTRSHTDPGLSSPVRPAGRRVGDLAAFYEERASEATSGRSSPYSQTRSLSHVPRPGHESGTPSRITTQTPFSPSTRASSPTKLSTMSTFLGSSRAPPTGTSAYGHDQSSYALSQSLGSRPTSPAKASTSGFLSPPASQTSGFASSVRSQGSSKVASSVRNIVAAWKERTPSLGKTSRGSSASTEGFFSIRRRAQERGAARAGESSQPVDEMGARAPPVPEKKDSSTIGSSPSKRSAASSITAPFDFSELGPYARGSQEPRRVGHLWYLNVHGPPPYRWQKCQAVLYPTMLLLSWIAPGGGRGVVTLDLVNCTEVRSVPSPNRAEASDDIGTLAARMMDGEDRRAEGSNLVEMLCPIQLLYTDGVERLAAESGRERMRWVGAVWDILARGTSFPSDQSSRSRSPVPSIRSIPSVPSLPESAGSGTTSTIFMPPMESIPDLPTTLSHRSSVSSRHSVSDDSAVSNGSLLYVAGQNTGRLIPPSRSSSLRRTSSLADLEADFLSARSDPSSSGDGSKDAHSIYYTPTSRTPKSLSQVSSSGSEHYSTASYGAVSTRAASSRFPTTESHIAPTSRSDAVSPSFDTRIVPSTLSLRNTTDQSLLGDSHDGTRSVTGASTTSSFATRPTSQLSSASSPRRRTPRTASRTQSRGDSPRTLRTVSGSQDEDSEKENSVTEGTKSVTTTPTRRTLGTSRTQTRDTEGASIRFSSDISGFTTQSWTESFTLSPSATPTRSRSEVARSVASSDDQFFSAPSGQSSATSQPRSSYDTAVPAPSSTRYESARGSSSDGSFKSLSTMEASEYQTCSVCGSISDYQSALTCGCPSDYTTASVCPSEPETIYDTAELAPSTPRRPSTVVSSLTSLSLLPPLPSSRESTASPKPQSLYSRTSSKAPTSPPSIPSEAPSPPRSLATTPRSEIVVSPPLPASTPGPSHVTTPSLISTARTGTPSWRTISIPSYPSTSPLLSSVPTSTYSSATPTLASPSPSILSLSLSLPSPTISTRSLSLPSPSTLSVPSVTSRPPSSPSATPTSSSELSPSSVYASESDASFSSSMLAGTMSLRSSTLHDGPDVSFDTSFLRASRSTDSGALSVRSATPRAPTISLPPPTPPPRSPAPPPQIAIVPTTPERSLTEPSSPSFVEYSSSQKSPSSSVTPTPSTFGDSPPSPSVSEAFTFPRRTSSVVSSDAPSRSLPDLPTRTATPSSIPLPSSPVPPDVSLSVSVSTPHSDVPSIRSDLSTVPSVVDLPLPEPQPLELPDVALRGDIQNVLDMLRDIDGRRGEENQGVRDHLANIGNALRDLASLIPTAESRPPPVPVKDESVGRTNISSERLPSSPRLLTPPPMRFPSPSSLYSSVSYLSSHHSDDDLFMQSEGSVSSVPSSATSTQTPSSVTGSLPLTPMEEVPPLPPSPPQSSPPPSSVSALSSSTVRAAPAITLVHLRDIVENIRAQVAALAEGQRLTNQNLERLAARPPAPAPAPRGLDESHYTDNLMQIQDLLNALRNAVDGLRPQEESSVTESSLSSLSGLENELRRRWRDVDLENILAPIPRRPVRRPEPAIVSDSDVVSPPLVPRVHTPPAVTPFVTVPPQVVSPPIASPPPRPFRSAPVDFGDVPRQPPFEGPRRARRTPLPPRSRAPEERYEDYPSVRQPPRQAAPDDDIDFEAALRDARRQRGRGDATGVFTPPPQRTATRPDQTFADERQRAPTAPPTLGGRRDSRISQPWYRPAGQDSRRQQGQQPVLPADFQTSAPPSVPSPVPGVEAPAHPLIDTLLEHLRENRLAQSASLEQQREMMRYMRSLNDWLARDVEDRQREIRSLGARIDQLRNELAQNMNIRPTAAVGPDGRPIFPGPGLVAPQPMPLYREGREPTESSSSSSSPSPVIPLGQPGFPPGFIPTGPPLGPQFGPGPGLGPGPGQFPQGPIPQGPFPFPPGFVPQPQPQGFIQTPGGPIPVGFPTPGPAFGGPGPGPAPPFSDGAFVPRPPTGFQDQPTVFVRPGATPQPPPIIVQSASRHSSPRSRSSSRSDRTHVPHTYGDPTHTATVQQPPVVIPSQPSQIFVQPQPSQPFVDAQVPQIPSQTPFIQQQPLQQPGFQQAEQPQIIINPPLPPQQVPLPASPMPPMLPVQQPGIVYPPVIAESRRSRSRSRSRSPSSPRSPHTIVIRERPSRERTHRSRSRSRSRSPRSRSQSHRSHSHHRRSHSRSPEREAPTVIIREPAPQQPPIQYTQPIPPIQPSPYPPPFPQTQQPATVIVERDRSRSRSRSSGGSRRHRHSRSHSPRIITPGPTEIRLPSSGTHTHTHTPHVLSRRPSYRSHRSRSSTPPPTQVIVQTDRDYSPERGRRSRERPVVVHPDGSRLEREQSPIVIRTQAPSREPSPRYEQPIVIDPSVHRTYSRSRSPDRRSYAPSHRTHSPEDRGSRHPSHRSRLSRQPSREGSYSPEDRGRRPLSRRPSYEREPLSRRPSHEERPPSRYARSHSSTPERYSEPREAYATSRRGSPRIPRSPSREEPLIIRVPSRAESHRSRPSRHASPPIIVPSRPPSRTPSRATHVHERTPPAHMTPRAPTELIPGEQDSPSRHSRAESEESPRDRRYRADSPLETDPRALERPRTPQRLAPEEYDPNRYASSAAPSRAPSRAQEYAAPTRQSTRPPSPSHAPVSPYHGEEAEPIVTHPAPSRSSQRSPQEGYSPPEAHPTASRQSPDVRQPREYSPEDDSPLPRVIQVSSRGSQYEPGTRPSDERYGRDSHAMERSPTPPSPETIVVPHHEAAQPASRASPSGMPRETARPAHTEAEVPQQPHTRAPSRVPSPRSELGTESPSPRDSFIPASQRSPPASRPLSVAPALTETARTPIHRTPSERRSPGTPATRRTPAEEEGEPVEPVQQEADEKEGTPSVEPSAGDGGDQDSHEERRARFEQAQQELDAEAAEAERQRQAAFDEAEAERQRKFDEAEALRNAEAEKRKQEIEAEEERVQQDNAAAIQEAAERMAAEMAERMAREMADQIAERRIAEILETVKEERAAHDRDLQVAAEERQRLDEAAAVERERRDEEIARERQLRDEAAAQEQLKTIEQFEDRIRGLEEELRLSRETLETERDDRIKAEAQRAEEEATKKEERHLELLGRFEALSGMMLENRDICNRKKEDCDARYEAEQARNVEKDEQLHRMEDTLQHLLADRNEDRRLAEERHDLVVKANADTVEALQKQVVELKALLDAMAEGWRTDSLKNHEATLEAVRQTAQEQVPFNVQKYLDEFSRALASEVRMLLDEVGKLREERRTMQFELAYLFEIRSKYEGNGIFNQGWQPTTGPFAPQPQVPPPPPPPPEPEPPRAPAWHPANPPKGSRISKKGGTGKKAKEAAAAAATQAPPAAAPAGPRAQVASWSTWQVNPAYDPTPPGSDIQQLPERPEQEEPRGLFGPSTPPAPAGWAL